MVIGKSCGYCYVVTLLLYHVINDQLFKLLAKYTMFFIVVMPLLRAVLAVVTTNAAGSQSRLRIIGGGR